MTISFVVDTGAGYASARADGLVTYDDLLRHVADEHRQNALGLDEIFDARTATTNLTAAQVRALAHHTEVMLRSGRLGALAVVTRDDVAFGMARMYQILCDGLPVEVGVFREIADAQRWMAELQRDRFVCAGTNR